MAARSLSLTPELWEEVRQRGEEISGLIRECNVEFPAGPGIEVTPYPPWLSTTPSSPSPRKRRGRPPKDLELARFREELNEELGDWGET